MDNASIARNRNEVQAFILTIDITVYPTAPVPAGFSVVVQKPMGLKVLQTLPKQEGQQ